MSGGDEGVTCLDGGGTPELVVINSPPAGGGPEGEEVEEPERADPAIGSRTNGATSIAWCGYGSAFVIERSSSAPDSSDGLGRFAGAT